MIDFLPALNDKCVKSSSEPFLSNEIYPSSSQITKSYFSNLFSNALKVQQF